MGYLNNQDTLNMGKTLVALPLTDNGYPIIARTDSTDAVNQACSKQETPAIIGFNYARQNTQTHKIVHFYLEDYMINAVWNAPSRYIGILKRHRAAFTPDFSLYRDMAMPLQSYNHFRKQWVGAYWQSEGISVIPTVGWSTQKSYEFCFEGIPKKATVTVATTGCIHNKIANFLFLKGYEKMLEVLSPACVLVYGSKRLPLGGNVIYLGDRRYGNII